MAPEAPAAPSPSLLGQSTAQPTQAGPSPEQESSAFMAEIRDLTMRITSLAQQYPQCAEDFEVSVQSLINGMTKAIISQSTTEPGSAPNLVG